MFNSYKFLGKKCLLPMVEDESQWLITVVYLYVYHCLFLINGEVTDGGERSHDFFFLRNVGQQFRIVSLVPLLATYDACHLSRRFWEPWFHSGRVIQRLKLGA